MNQVDLHQTVDIDKIKKLSKIVFKKKAHYDALCMAGEKSGFDKRLEQSVEYEVAGAELMKAERNLYEAKRTYSQQKNQ